jgi:ADP-Ribosyltransferase in polyvalent proteins
MTTPWLNTELAPNGLAIQENFARWFGQSRAIDRDANPLVLFHGTQRNFDGFRASKVFSEVQPKTKGGKAAKGRSLFYFSSSADVAAEFANQHQAPKKGGLVIPVHLSLQNPLVIDAEGKDWGHTFDRVVAAHESKEFDGVIIRNSQDGMRREGAPSDVFVAFSAGQIKSAVGNSGLYLKDSESLTDSKEALELAASQKARQVIPQTMAVGKRP